MLSQRKKEYVYTENRLAYSILREAASNHQIKKNLKEIAAVLITNVLNPMRAIISQAKQFTDINPQHQQLFTEMAAEHSAEKRQYGAVMPEVASAKDILQSMPKLHELIERQANVLNNIDAVHSIDDMAIVMKIMVELGYTYYEAKVSEVQSLDINDPKYKEFKFIQDIIAPNSVELDSRISRAELNESPRLSLSFGIGTEEDDFVQQCDKRGRNTGKSVFAAVSMQTRLELICKEYDKTHSNQTRAKMQTYQIPLNPTERSSLPYYAKRWKSFFEKLVADPITGETLPLIAGVSRATARLLVTLQHLNAFQKADGHFDFDKLQIIANCIMGFIVHGGHHSLDEVGEVYNRTIDCASIQFLEKKQQPIIPIAKEKNAEVKLPYYHVGNFCSFFHSSIRNKFATIVREDIDVTPQEMTDSAFGHAIVNAMLKR